jgi:hypothetical protein
LPGRRRRPSAGPTTAPPTRLPDRRRRRREWDERGPRDWLDRVGAGAFSFFFSQGGRD